MPQTFLDEGLEVRVFEDTDMPADPEAITAAEWAAGVDLSDQLVVDETDLGQDASDTIEERVYSDKGKVSVPTLKNAHATLVIRRSRNASTGVLDGSDRAGLFNDRQIFLIAVRQGVGVDVSAAAGQDYWFGQFQADTCQGEKKPTGGYDKLTVTTTHKSLVGEGVIAA